MRYIVRLNPKAFNPLTRKLIENRLWEVEQVADKDSGTVIWHCGDVRFGNDRLVPPVDAVKALFAPRDLSKSKPPVWDLRYIGYAARGQDNAIVIIGVQDNG
jgi:hypothetical protein